MFSLARFQRAARDRSGLPAVIACTLLLMSTAASGAQAASSPETRRAANSSAANLAQTARPSRYPSGANSELGRRVAELLAEPAVARARWGIAVTAVDGTPLFGLDEDKYFRPASNTKLFTTAAAMQYLAATKVETRVAGPVDWAHLGRDGVLAGDLLLAGRGDANLSDRTLPYVSPAERRENERRQREQGLEPPPPNPLRKIDALAAELAEHGLKRVTGNVVGDDTLWPSEPYGSDWSIDDAVDGDGPPVSALSIIDNVLTVRVVPGTKAGDPAAVSLFPDIGYYMVTSSVATVAQKGETHIRIEHDLNTRAVHVRGMIAAGAPYLNEVAIDDPAEFAAMALKGALEAHGVQVDGKAVARHRANEAVKSFLEESRSTTPPLGSHLGAPSCSFGFACEGFGGQTLATIASPALLEDITVTLKVSQNLHAELLLRRLGKLLGSDGSVAQGARVVREFLLNAGLDGEDFVFYDGSGLSGHNLVTPRATAQLLAYAARQPWFAGWKMSLPVGGVDGSLASRFPDLPLKGHVFAKTGTLGESRALSGYLDAASGRTVIFSIMADNHAPGSTADRVIMDKIVAAIQALN